MKTIREYIDARRTRAEEGSSMAEVVIGMVLTTIVMAGAVAIIPTILSASNTSLSSATYTENYSHLSNAVNPQYADVATVAQEFNYFSPECDNAAESIQPLNYTPTPGPGECLSITGSAPHGITIEVSRGTASRGDTTPPSLAARHLIENTPGYEHLVTWTW